MSVWQSLQHFCLLEMTNSKGPYKRTQQVTTLLGPTMLGVVGSYCVVHDANERNNCQHCWRKAVVLALITALSVPSFSYICLRNTRPRGKSFPREGQSAVPPRGLTIFRCTYLRFFIFCLNKRLMFPQILRSTLLDTPYLQQSRKKKTRYDYLFIF